ncbi:putative oxygen-independent coproporphyrinogen III oxidase [Parabacteroides sp. PFB2-12]|uniref:radical SAM family heme chaperone HemW n=1 Tax=unclassified Parabacteroides TaxID=2649774 RepID=UPI002477263F|nr:MULTISPECIES: radical SAM family heme chaperone HemW [unclassified Parabacteroides]MDH6344090.1 putative oxygen-independent coproporphyrinogen III oxidase [Parabacteroides sp. PM6-13]MDH6391847.1 putative oxygen-independent coproporphyrinogen III oxidase [Parabacteroides sp. PFB2-12]
MAGLYIHIPFCAKRCLYCDFFSNTDMSYKEAYLKALTHEIALRCDYLEGKPLETIYFGGGTPSQLSASDYAILFESITKHFDLSNLKEVTLEANPDDMTAVYVKSLSALPFNRISLGVQSFDADDLLFLNRRHTAEQAVQAVEHCREYGFTNLSIDLIYGLPGQTAAKWQANLEAFLRLDIPHLSAYHLIYEEGTPLYRLWQEGKAQAVDEEVSLQLFSALIDSLTEAGYESYEISNFARPGYLSKHNSSYWNDKEYLGAGPSAHSYNGKERGWNVASLPRYLQGIEKGKPDFEVERLTLTEQYNDYIITRLRTMWGLSYSSVLARFGESYLSHCQREAIPFCRQGLLIEEGDNLRLSRAGIFLSDTIMRDLLF